MKKSICALCAVLFAVTGAFAVNPNLSIDYVRMPARYATVNSPDAVLYNPAGLVKLQNGLYFDIGNQFVYKKYSFKQGSSDAVFNDPSTGFNLFFPSATVTFKQNNWGIFFGWTIPDGGGNLKYEYGATGFKTKMEASSGWMDFTLGGSYAFNDVFSVSLGARMLTANQTTKTTQSGTVVFDKKYEGMGFSGQFGVNITPVEKLNIGLLYKSVVFWTKNDKTQFSTDVNKPTFYGPHTVSVGVGYDVIENLNVQVGYKLNLESLAPEFYPDTQYANSMDFSLGAEWQINQFIKPSLGVAYQMGRQKGKSNQYNIYNPDMNAIAIGAGAVITPIKDLDITIGYMAPIFLPESVTDYSFTKFVQVFGIGVGYRFL